MSKEISAQEVMVGDTIRIIREKKVKQVIAGVHVGSAYIAPEGDDADARYSLMDAKIELVERPLPPLPTHTGSVIRVIQNHGYGTGIWMLGVNEMWQSPNGAHQTPERLTALLQQVQSTFEVLA